jgi:glycosyltransferase involved in cell wall biosynthesis
MNPFTASAFICVRNEEDILPWTLRHLVDQGIGVHIIDNWSTDRSVEIAREFPLVGFERFPVDGDSGRFAWAQLLRRVEELAAESAAQWCILHDADEIRRSPRTGEAMIEALERIDREGYNAADHRLLYFHPVDDLYRGDPESHFAYFSEVGVDNRLPHIKAWKNGGRVSLADSGGHEAVFPGRKVYPEKLILKHYPIRSREQFERKVLHERIPRFDPAERARGWHVQYNDVARTRQWMRDPATLTDMRQTKEAFCSPHRAA